MHISMRIHFVHACALLMSPGTTCDLGKGEVSVLMWQLMPFPSLTDGTDRPWHDTGTAAGCQSNREREVRGCEGGKGKGAFKVVFVCAV